MFSLDVLLATAESPWYDLILRGLLPRVSTNDNENSRNRSVFLFRTDYICAFCEVGSEPDFVVVVCFLFGMFSLDGRSV